MFGLPWLLSGKNAPNSAEEAGSSLGREDPLAKEDNQLLYSCLENPMDRGAWQATVVECQKSWTALSTRAMHFHSRIVVVLEGKKERI